jgi:hypothetical protein
MKDAATWFLSGIKIPWSSHKFNHWERIKGFYVLNLDKTKIYFNKSMGY